MVRRRTQQDGQVLILVALACVVLVAFLASALDVGHLYSVRRAMQNAADAGALAGARTLCMDLGASAAKAQAEEYRSRNGGEGPEPVIDGYSVRVTAVITAPTFFAGIIGIREAEVAAEAEATCGCSNGACGMWPIAFRKDRWDAAVASGACGKPFLLWDDKGIDCTVYSCADPVTGEQYAAIPGEFRTWMDFSAKLINGAVDPCDQPGCGNSELRDRVVGTNKSGEECYSYIRFGCNVGDSGVKADSWKEAIKQRGIVRIPLYSSTGCVMEDDPGNTCSSERYNVVSFACVRIMDSFSIMKLDGTGPPVRVLKAQMVCPNDPGVGDCYTACGTATEPVTDGCLRTVSLSR